MPSRLTAFGVTFGIAALMVYVLVTGSDLLIPLAIAIMIWYLINALSRTFEVRLKVPGWLALTLSITALVVGLGLIVEMISGNIAAVRSAAPTRETSRVPSSAALTRDTAGPRSRWPTPALRQSGT